MFRGYGKIPESSKQWLLTKEQQSAFKKTKWVVTEKVHGANFCFILSYSPSHSADGNHSTTTDTPTVSSSNPSPSFVMDNVKIQCAKKKEILSENEDFFGHKSLLGRYSKRIRKLFLEIFNHERKLVERERIQDFKIYVFGEIFGGKYPHKSVEADPNVQPIQTGIWYCPGIEFYGFDIGIEDQSKDLHLQFVDYDIVIELFKTSGMTIFAEPLFIGTYEQALEYKLGFESTLPAKMNLPRIEKNKAEGIVIKPIKDIWIDTKKGKQRAIIKLKIEEFSEDKRFLEAEKWKTTTNSNTTQGNESNALQMIQYEIQALLTENRIHNAISKIGRIDDPLNQKDKVKELLDMYSADVADQMKEDNETEWNELSPQEQHLVMEEIVSESKKMIVEYFKKQRKNPNLKDSNHKK